MPKTGLEGRMIPRSQTQLSDRTGIALYKRTPAQVSEVIVHYDGGRTPKTAAEEVQLLKIYDRHHAANGWGGIGYNLAVGPATGAVYEARGLDRVGAHTQGHNTAGIGVVLIGGEDALTGKAKQGLRAAYAIAAQWAGKTLEVSGHKDHANTSCPGSKTYAWLKTGEITMSTYIIEQGVKIAPGTLYHYRQLAAAFKKATGLDLLLTSGLRTYAEQKSLYDRWKAGTFHAPDVAPPGTSRHETGRALDLRDSGTTPGVTVAGNPRSNWMLANASKYGFDPTGAKWSPAYREPWHFELLPHLDPWTAPKQKEGFLMALSDKQQKDLYDAIMKTNGRVRDMKDYLTQGGPRGTAPTILTKILSAVTATNARTKNVQDIATNFESNSYVTRDGSWLSHAEKIEENQRLTLDALQTLNLRLEALEAGK